MNIKNMKSGKPKAGVLMIASPRFRNLGESLPRGTYHERNKSDVEDILNSLREDLDIIFPGIIYQKEDMHKAMDLFYANKADFVLAEFLSWSEDFAWVRFLRDMPEIPVLFVNNAKEKMSFKTSADEDDFIDFLCSGTLVGSLEGAGSVPRTERKNVKFIMGSREENISQILTYSKAAKVRSILKQASFGLLASYNELMWSTYVDPYNFFTRIGPELHFISYSLLTDEISSVSKKEAEKYQEELKGMYRVAEDVQNDTFFASARASLAIARLTERLNIDAMVFNDVDHAMFKMIGLRPGFYHPSFNQNLSIMVPEADVGAGTITFILKLLSGKHISFVEPFHIEAANNTFAGGHAGPHDHTDPAHRENVIIARDVRFAKTKFKYAGAPFAWYRIPAGRKTFAQLTENNGKFKMVSALADAIDGEHILVSYSHGIFKPLIPVKEFFKKILQIGTTQHFAIVDGDYRKELSILAEMMGFEYYEII
jgi:L-arabinose isomerase